MQQGTLEWFPRKSFLVVAAAISSAAILGLFAFGRSEMAVFLVLSSLLGIPGLCQYLSSPLLRIAPDSLEYVPFLTPPRRPRFQILGYFPNGRLDKIESCEVKRLQWDGVDSIGVRLTNGEIVSVSFLEVPPSERDEARRAILAFIAKSAHAA